MKTINIKTIRTNGLTQSRVEIDNAVVSEYAEALRAGAEFPAVVVFNDGADNWLADGFHRYHAHNQAGKTSIAADVRQGTLRDAKLYSFGANGAHGQRPTNADKRKAVSEMLADSEWASWSQEKIARTCCVSIGFVSKMVHEVASLHGEEIRPAVRTVERNGKTYEQNTAKIGIQTDRDHVKANNAVATEAPAASAGSDDGMLSEAELIAEMQETQAENQQLQERVVLMASDDKAAEIDKLLTRINGLEGRINQLMMQVKTSSDGEKYHANVIHKLRKLLNVESHKEIIDAVAALVADRRLAA